MTRKYKENITIDFERKAGPSDPTILFRGPKSITEGTKGFNAPPLARVGIRRALRNHGIWTRVHDVWHVYLVAKRSYSTDDCLLASGWRAMQCNVMLLQCDAMGCHAM